MFQHAEARLGTTPCLSPHVRRQALVHRWVGSDGGASARFLGAIFQMIAVLALHLVFARPAAAEITAPPAPQVLPVAGSGEGVPATSDAASDAAPAPSFGGAQLENDERDASDSSNLEECAEAARVSIKKEYGLAGAGLVLLVLIFIALRHVCYSNSFGFRSPIGRFLLVLLLVMVAASAIGGAVRRFGAYRAGKDQSEFDACRATVEADTEHQITIGPDGRKIRVKKVRAVYRRSGLYSIPAAVGIGSGTGLAVVLAGLALARFEYARRAKERT